MEEPKDNITKLESPTQAQIAEQQKKHAIKMVNENDHLIVISFKKTDGTNPNKPVEFTDYVVISTEAQEKVPIIPILAGSKKLISDQLSSILKNIEEQNANMALGR